MDFLSPLAPRLRGEGWGEGDSPQPERFGERPSPDRLRFAAAVDPRIKSGAGSLPASAPQAGRGCGAQNNLCGEAATR
jgi:hypothetical protein